MNLTEAWTEEESPEGELRLTVRVPATVVVICPVVCPLTSVEMAGLTMLSEGLLEVTWGLMPEMRLPKESLRVMVRV